MPGSIPGPTEAELYLPPTLTNHMFISYTPPLRIDKGPWMTPEAVGKASYLVPEDASSLNSAAHQLSDTVEVTESLSFSFPHG